MPSASVSVLVTSRLRPSIVALALVVGGAPSAWGHAAGENYVWFNLAENHLEGRFEIRLPDLRDPLGLDIPEDYDAM